MAIGDLDDPRDAGPLLDVGANTRPRRLAVGRVETMEGIGLDVFRFGENAIEVEENRLGPNDRYSAASLLFSVE